MTQMQKKAFTVKSAYKEPAYKENYVNKEHIFMVRLISYKRILLYVLLLYFVCPIYNYVILFLSEIESKWWI